jgi:hypothetical protein
LTEDIPSGCDDQCKNPINLYKQMHECNPSLCYWDEPDEIPNLYNGEYVPAPEETQYDKDKFGMFELNYLFLVFYLMNFFQVLNSLIKWYVKKGLDKDEKE